jgi:hypothetical protein
LGEAISQFSVTFGVGFQGRGLLIGVEGITIEAILLIKGAEEDLPQGCLGV